MVLYVANAPRGLAMRLPFAASDRRGGDGKPCTARVSLQEVPAARYEQVLPVFLTKVPQVLL